MPHNREFQRNPEKGSGLFTYRDVRTGGDDRHGVDFGVVEGGNTEMGGQAQASLGGWDIGVNQVHHFSIFSENVVYVGFLVL